MADENTLASTEYSAVGRALLDMIASYTGFPSGCTFRYQDITKQNEVGLFTTPGGKYLLNDVVGGFVAQLPFQIVYRCDAVSSTQNLKAEEILDGVATYLENMEYPSLTGGRNILKVYMDSITYRTEASADGSTQYARTGKLRYEKL